MKVLVVGRGYMGANHERVLRARGVETITVDPDPSRDADHRAMRQASNADLAVVSVPPSELASVAEEAMLRAPRVLVDKPMASTREQARSLLNAAESSGAELLVAFTERANPGFRALRAALELVGPIRHLSAVRLGPPPRNWRCDPGVDVAGHCFDMARAIGFEPAPVMGECRDGTARYRAEIEGGTLEVLVSQAARRKVRTFTVVGPNGMLALDKREQSVYFLDAEGASPIEVRREEPLQVLWREVLDGSWEATGKDGEVALDLSLTRIAGGSTATRRRSSKPRLRE
jgi:predicted dehydrogenase